MGFWVNADISFQQQLGDGPGCFLPKHDQGGFLRGIDSDADIAASSLPVKPVFKQQGVLVRRAGTFNIGGGNDNGYLGALKMRQRGAHLINPGKRLQIETCPGHSQGPAPVKLRSGGDQEQVVADLFLAGVYFFLRRIYFLHLPGD